MIENIIIFMAGLFIGAFFMGFVHACNNGDIDLKILLRWLRQRLGGIMRKTLMKKELQKRGSRKAGDVVTEKKRGRPKKKPYGGKK